MGKRPNQPYDNYKYYAQANKVHAVSSFAGKPVKATATCHEDDTYDYNTGCKVAAKKCNVKVATKRLRHAETRYKAAMNKYIEAYAEYVAAFEYQQYAQDTYNEAMNDLLDYYEEIDRGED